MKTVLCTAILSITLLLVIFSPANKKNAILQRENAVLYEYIGNIMYGSRKWHIEDTKRTDEKSFKTWIQTTAEALK